MGADMADAAVVLNSDGDESCGEEELQSVLEDLKSSERRLQIEIARYEQQLAVVSSKKAHVQAKLADLELKKDDRYNRAYSAETFQWSGALREIMRNYYGIHSFRENQLEAMNSILMKIDTLLIMPTGGGKSLCFQVPTLVHSHGLTVVVSPLISLMTDQVMSLRSLGIHALMITSYSTKAEASVVRESMKLLHKPLSNESDSMWSASSSLRFLYVTPERISKSKQFMSSLEKIYDAGNLLMIVIDEVHCVSQWGHSFRQDYLRLSILKQHFSATPLLLITATATAHVTKDIKKTLSLRNCRVLRSHINRPNLYYAVQYKPKQTEEILQIIADFIMCFSRSTAGIIYCITKKDAQVVSDELQGKYNISCAFYHADMDAPTRDKVHESWSCGDIQIVVATIAFGMGIDKEDVRFVIHHSLPKSLESYYQESGRAGRDGLPAYCLILYRPSDAFRHSVMVYWEDSGLPLLYQMVKYCTSHSLCRRLLISQHFGETPVECGSMCDVCTVKTTQKQRTYFTTDLNEKDCLDGLQREVHSSGRKRSRNVGKVGENSSSKDALQSLEAISSTCNLKTLSTAVSILLHYLRSIQDNINEKVTLIQLQTEWKRRISKLQHFGHTSLRADSETLQSIILNLVICGLLKEEFYHTPYATNSYIKLSDMGLRTYESIATVRDACEDILKVQDTFLDGVPGRMLKIPSNMIMEIMTFKKADTSSLALENGDRKTRYDKLQGQNRLNQTYFCLQNKVKSIAASMNVFAHYILKDEQLHRLVNLCENSIYNGSVMTLELVCMEMPKRKVDLYGQKILDECLKCISLMTSSI